MLDAEVEGGTGGGSLMEDELLQSVQHLDPHQVHEHHDQETHT